MVVVHELPADRVSGFRYEMRAVGVPPAVWLERGQQLEHLESGVPTAVHSDDRRTVMVMIGVDPHKRSHTAVAIDSNERVLDERLVRATAGQVPELVEWAGTSRGVV